MKINFRPRVAVVLAAFVLLISACSSTGNPPDALAFEEPDPSTIDEPVDDPADDPAAPEAPEASTTTEAPVVETRPRPTCSSHDYFVDFGTGTSLIVPNRTSQGPFAVAPPAGTYLSLIHI